MKLNKKAIMVEFLVTVLIALLIFAPTCYFTSKLFRLSDQARDNFALVVTDIKEASKFNGATKTDILIMDKDTALVTFQANKDHNVKYPDCGNLKAECEDGKYKLETETATNHQGTQTHHTFTSTTYPYPSACKEKNCVCLCQERKIELQKIKEETVILGTVTNTLFQHEIVTCTKLACEFMDGINIEPFHYYREENDQRRLLLEVTRSGDTVHMKVK